VATATNAPWSTTGVDILSQTRRIVWDHEGGQYGTEPHVHPKDAGGRTRAGLTWRCYSQDFLRMPQGELCPVEQFDALTLDDIVDVMLEVFGLRTNVYRIEDPRIRFAVLDAAILFGAPRAAMFLQAAVKVQADGIIGVQTLLTVNRHPEPDLVVERIVCSRNERHVSRVLEKPDQIAFLLGWINRGRKVLTWRPLIAALLLTLFSVYLASADDGFETSAPIPRSSLGTSVPTPVGTVLTSTTKESAE
jgi:lysozyme family protein